MLVSVVQKPHYMAIAINDNVFLNRMTCHVFKQEGIEGVKWTSFRTEIWGNGSFKFKKLTRTI